MPGLEPGVRWSELTADLFENEFSEHGDLVSRNGQQFVVTQEQTGGSERIILLTDVTDQRQVDEVVARHRRLAGLGEMLATLAHQLRTPITAALLYATNAQEPTLSADRRTALLEKAAQCMRDLETLVADMLVFARGNSSRGEQAVDVAGLLDAVQRTVSPHRVATQTLVFDLPDSAISVRGNPRVLASALENIVINALQCAGAQAHVRVSAALDTRSGDASEGISGSSARRRFADQAVNAASALCVRIEVSDDGPGVHPGDEQRIFEPFYSSRRGGTGLGLAAARSIVRAHRGDVQLSSEPGAGARFIVTLPLLEDSNHE
jgi:two-component system sensor histidine kinase FlrB